MDTKIKKLLEKHNVKYEVVEHRKVYTAFNAAETQHISAKEVIKTVLIKLDKALAFYEEPEAKVEKFNMVLIAIPAGKRVGFKKIDKFIFDTQARLYKKLIKKNPKLPKPIKVKTSMAKERDITSKLKTKVGLIAPLGSLYNIPVFFDKKLEKNKNLIFSAGSYTESIKMKPKDFIKLEQPILGNFTE